jgi:hypothetical protein
MLDGASMTVLRTFIAVALLGGVGGSLAHAGSISISVTSTAELKDGKLSVALKISNSGDEAANSVVTILRQRDREARGTRHESVNPGETIEETLSVPAGDLGPGRWPFRIATDYTDANQYPFEALHVGMVTVGDPSPTKVAVPQITIPPVSETGTVSMTVKNLAGVVRDASLNVFAPDGLEVPDATQRLQLQAWETKEVRTGLVNRTALAGSRYPVFVVIEYDEDGAHQALVASNTVEIQPHRALISRGLLWVVGALIVAWLVVLLRRRRAPA